MKYILILCVFLALWALYLNFRLSRSLEEIAAIQAEKTEAINKFKECKDEKEAYIYAKQKSENTIGEIKTIIRTVKSPCNCYDTLVDASIVDRVRGNR